MELKGKIVFEELIQNDHFIQSVSDMEASEEFLSNLIINCPEKKQEILLAVEFIRFNKIQQKNISPEYREKLLASTLEKLDNGKVTLPPKRKTLPLKVVSRIAAAAIILLSIGYWGYTEYNKDIYKDFKLAVSNNVAEEGNSKLITSDGSEYVLDDEQSEVVYEDNGEKILINTESGDKVIENTSKKIKLNQLVVPYGKRQKLLLSDGSSVILNSGSKLIYPAEFKGNERRVFLEGEGFFKVVKRDDKMPFLVETDNMDIKVLGTEFNVSAYSNDQEVSAILVNGRVEVAQKNKLLNNPEFFLTPGQGCFYSVNEESSLVKEVDTENYVAWMKGYLKFEDQTLENIVRKLKRYYNREIVIEDEQFANIIISGKFALSEDFNSVLYNLSKLLKTNITTDENDVVIINKKE